MGGINKLPDEEVLEDELEQCEMEQSELDMNLDDTVKRKAANDMKAQILGAVAAVIPVLSLLGYQLEWFTVDNVSLVYTAISSVIFLVINVYSIWKNHYTSKRAQEQLRLLKKKGLK